MKTIDRKRLFKDLVHELGHPRISAIWRSMSDFADHYLSEKKIRAIYEGAVNSAENVVIDAITAKVLRLWD